MYVLFVLFYLNQQDEIAEFIGTVTSRSNVSGGNDDSDHHARSRPGRKRRAFRDFALNVRSNSRIPVGSFSIQQERTAGSSEVEDHIIN